MTTPAPKKPTQAEVTILWEKMLNTNLEPRDRYEACSALADAIEQFGAALPCPHGVMRERMVERTLEVANKALSLALEDRSSTGDDYAGPGFWLRPSSDVDEASTAIPFDLGAFGDELPSGSDYIHVVETGEWMRASGEL